MCTQNMPTDAELVKRLTEETCQAVMDAANCVTVKGRLDPNAESNATFHTLEFTEFGNTLDSAPLERLHAETRALARDIVLHFPPALSIQHERMRLTVDGWKAATTARSVKSLSLPYVHEEHVSKLKLAVRPENTTARERAQLEALILYVQNMKADMPTLIVEVHVDDDVVLLRCSNMPSIRIAFLEALRRDMLALFMQKPRFAAAATTTRFDVGRITFESSHDATNEIQIELRRNVPLAATAPKAHAIKKAPPPPMASESRGAPVKRRREEDASLSSSTMAAPPTMRPFSSEESDSGSDGDAAANDSDSDDDAPPPEKRLVGSFLASLATRIFS